MSEIVECDRCGLKVRLRKDDTYAVHGWTRYGVKTLCEYSTERYARHSGSIRIIKRNPDLWLCECRCGDTFTGDTYDAVEKPWLAHTEAVKAVAQ